MPLKPGSGVSISLSSGASQTSIPSQAFLCSSGGTGVGIEGSSTDDGVASSGGSSSTGPTNTGSSVLPTGVVGANGVLIGTWSSASTPPGPTTVTTGGARIFGSNSGSLGGSSLCQQSASGGSLPASSVATAPSTSELVGKYTPNRFTSSRVIPMPEGTPGIGAPAAKFSAGVGQANSSGTVAPIKSSIMGGQTNLPPGGPSRPSVPPRQTSLRPNPSVEDTDDTMKNLRKTFAGIFGDM
ncbi:unnamed protein product [Protopolystoma xenopodis]|uniref:Synapsin ATP-binding domain-containing protein n=1 Tax=Protopolystoma xenopodis TaxID=117903 RepID=A0A3S5A4Q3_9PLAT|nr:unnamed protein product [Protopolystoma xenopodis]